ncbi:hypothetical protein [Streptomyces nanshensis]|uniref:Lipoprotein n=1 Tax=Streptomyces nanshensis TaxID=518642 RepID=A0A1E7LC44_9ACTN|nr:hypothetical protein [Streptomyces nanshensis]OEV13738.1 hypothetical protein AN218_02055 [Streptomyces nanshensis]
MTLRTLPRAAVAGLTAVTALTLLSSCSSSRQTAEVERAKVKHAATSYMQAWLDKPSDPADMCRWQTKAMRPNHEADGGTIPGCIARYEDDFAEQDSDAGRGHLDIRVSHIQNVAATATQPRGKGALVTLHRSGEEPFRYALRLVPQSVTWRVSQTADVGSRYRHTDDPVDEVLEHTP